MGVVDIRMDRRARWSTLLAIGLIILVLGRACAQPERNWPPKAFPIGGWCSPPDPYITVEQYKRIAHAGFTMVLPPCEGANTVVRNHKILDTAKAAGLKAIIADPRIPLSMKDDKARADLKAVVNDYHKHPALMGYFLTDEPGADAFRGLAEVVAVLRQLDPDHMVYINLFPNYASTNLNATPSQLNTTTYDAYLDQYMKTVKPDVLSWDHYFFLKDGDRPGFFRNLASAERAAQLTSPPTPFWQIVLSVQHGGYRALTENELRYEAMQSLVYGAQGLIYFTYWEPNDSSFQWSNAIMKRDGTPGALYDAVSKVNQEVKVFGKWLYGSLWVESYQSGISSVDGTLQPNEDNIKVNGPGNLSYGVFRGANGYVYVLVANRDYKAPIESSLQLGIGDHSVEILDAQKNRWDPYKSKPDPDGNVKVSLKLGAAAGLLIRYQ